MDKISTKVEVAYIEYFLIHFPCNLIELFSVHE